VVFTVMVAMRVVAVAVRAVIVVIFTDRIQDNDTFFFRDVCVLIMLLCGSFLWCAVLAIVVGHPRRVVCFMMFCLQ
jgi:hypothetical protein